MRSHLVKASYNVPADLMLVHGPKTLPHAAKGEQKRELQLQPDTCNCHDRARMQDMHLIAWYSGKAEVARTIGFWEV